MFKPSLQLLLFVSGVIPEGPLAAHSVEHCSEYRANYISGLRVCAGAPLEQIVNMHCRGGFCMPYDRLVYFVSAWRWSNC